MNLYGLTGQSLELLKMIEDGDCTQEELAGALEVLNTSIETKVENTLYVIESAKGNRNILVNAISSLQSKLKALDSNVEWLQSSLFSNLELMGVSSYKAGVFTVKQQANPPSVNILDAKKVPAKYQTLIPESYVPRKADIAKDLKLGILVPGCELKNSTRWVVK
jgi:hypothetical protein